LAAGCCNEHRLNPTINDFRDARERLTTFIFELNLIDTPGHVDITILGAFEVSEKGDIASWKVPGKLIKGMGGAMDLVASAKNIIVAMQHTNKEGQSKLLKECTLPLTGVNCVKRIVSDLAVLDVTDKGFKLLERAPGVTVEQIQKATEGTLIVEGEIPEIQF